MGKRGILLLLAKSGSLFDFRACHREAGAKAGDAIE